MEVVRRMVDAFVRDDVEGALECLSPAVVWDPGLPDRPIYHGHEGVQAFFRSWLGAWEDYSFEQRELIDAGAGRVVSVFHERGTGRGSGLVVDTEFAGVYEVRDGQVVAWKRYPSRADAERAAGTG